MANRVMVNVYRFEYNPATGTNKISQSFQESISKDDVLSIDPVNSAGGQDIPGLPYLYGKITKKEPGINQELFVLNGVQDLQDKFNA